MTITSISSISRGPAVVGGEIVPSATAVAAPYGARGPIIAGTSITPNTIALGSHTFVMQQFGLGFSTGVRVRAAAIDAPDHWMEGICTAYGGNMLTIDVDLISDLTGTYNNWSIGVTGEPGADGEQGPAGAPGAPGEVPEAPANNLHYARRNNAWNNIDVLLDAKQPLDAELTALASVTSAADQLAYFTGAATAATTPLTAAARSVLDDATTAAMLTTLGGQPADADLAALAALTGIDVIYYRSAADTWSAVTIGAGISFSGGTLAMNIGSGGAQPYDAELNALAGLTSAADQLPFFTGSGTAALTTLTGFGRSLIDDPDAATARATLGAASSAALAGYQPLDSDLSSLAAASGIATMYYRKAADTWAVLNVGAGLSIDTGSDTLNVTAGGGNVSNVGTPTAGQLARWTGTNTIEGFTANYAPLASPVFTGDPQAPTPATADNDTSIATTAYVKNAAKLASTKDVFRAHLNNVGTGWPNGVTGKVNFTHETFDQNNKHVNGTWTPSAGPVFLHGQAYFSGVNASAVMTGYIYKNGAAISISNITSAADFQGNTFAICVDIANGTDYYEFWLSVSGSGPNLNGNPALTFFEGFQL